MELGCSNDLGVAPYDCNEYMFSSCGPSITLPDFYNIVKIVMCLKCALPNPNKLAT